MTSLEIKPPEYDPSEEDDDVEYFYLRAPAHLDVSEIMNGVTLNLDITSLDKSSSQSTHTVISEFKSEVNNKEYSLSLMGSKETEGMRLLVPDNDDEDKLIPFKPFRGQINLTEIVTCPGEKAVDSSSNIQTDLLLAPAVERAPKPAFGQSGNGAVDKMRLAYVHVPQRDGLKRRWVIPGSSAPQPVAIEENVSKRSHNKAKKSSKQ